jgi:hypothetical protein
VLHLRSLRVLLVAVLVLTAGACGEAPPAEPAAEPATPVATPAPEVDPEATLEPATTPEPTPAETTLFTCVTEKHRAVIVDVGGKATYRSWSVDADPATTPDMEVMTGSVSSWGSGPCRVASWTYPVGDVTFTVQQGGCDNPDAPAAGPWSGALIVKRGETELSNRKCGPHGRSKFNAHTVVWRPGKAWVEGPVPQTIYEDRTEEIDGAASEDSFTMLSVTGPIVAFDHSWYGEGGAHPSYGIRRKTVDITAPGMDVNLIGLFDRRALRDALVAHPALSQQFGDVPPAEVEDVIAALDGGCEMDLGKGLTKEFSIGAMTDTTVAVQLGVSHGCEVARGTFTTLDLVLPRPTSGYFAP